MHVTHKHNCRQMSLTLHTHKLNKTKQKKRLSTVITLHLQLLSNTYVVLILNLNVKILLTELNYFTNYPPHQQNISIVSIFSVVTIGNILN